MASAENHGSGARALTGEYYTSPAIFEHEQQRVFSRRWLLVGHQSALARPGSHVVREPVPGESVIVVRGEDQAVRAFYNVCRHRGARLVVHDGESPSKCLRCPYHAWTYGLDGRLLGARCMDEVDEFDRAAHSLIPVATSTWEGFVFVNLDPQPLPIERTFAPLAGRLTPWQIPRLVIAARVEYEIAANWKLLFQNFSECYHCPIVHPALNRITPFDADTDSAFPHLWAGELLGGPMLITRADGSLTESGRLCGPPLVAGPERTHVHYYMLFPSMFVSLLPDYVLTHRLEPLAVDRTRVICEWLLDPAYSQSDTCNPQDAVELWDRVNREDWHVCELIQQSARSRGFVPGCYAEHESVSAAFDRAYLDALGELDYQQT